MWREQAFAISLVAKQGNWNDLEPGTKDAH